MRKRWKHEDPEAHLRVTTLITQQYLRGAPWVMNGSRNEDPSLAINGDSLRVIGHWGLSRSNERRNNKKQQQVPHFELEAHHRDPPWCYWLLFYSKPTEGSNKEVTLVALVPSFSLSYYYSLLSSLQNDDQNKVIKISESEY